MSRRTETPAASVTETAIPMSTQLFSNPQPVHRETIFSYLARLAAAKATSPNDLVYDMGASFKLFYTQDIGAFERVAEWVGLPAVQYQEMLSWTGIKLGSVRIEFRGEVFVSRAVRNPVVRGCPVCLRLDAACAPRSPSTAMAMRGDWQLREVTLCVRHCHPLVPLWEAQGPRQRYDVGARLKEIEASIMSGALSRPSEPVSQYDLWLDRRLEGLGDDTWMKDKSLFAATTFCRLLGMALLKNEGHNPNFADLVNFRKAQIEGFSIAKEGETAIRSALDRLAIQATGKFDEPYKVFGRMFDRLSHEYRDETGFAPFRQILRECILDHWAVTPGKMLLGEVVHELRVHTVRSAALETGVEPEFLEQFLIDAGAIHEKDTRSYSRKTFDAQAHASLLKDIRELVGTIPMRDAMNATRKEFTALEADGILVPRTRRPKVRKRWRLSDGRALVEELQSHCVGVDEEDDGWETLQRSRQRTGIRLPKLIEAIRSRRIKCGQRTGIPGYHGIVVLRAEADDLAETVPSSVKNSEFDLPGVMSAAAFGRSLGLRDKGYFQALVDAGHTPAERVINPRTHRSQYQVSASDIETFHRKFVTLTALADETGLHRNTLRSLLLRIGVSPFSPNGEDFGPVYLKTEIQEALAAMRAQNLRELSCGPDGISTASKCHLISTD